MLTGCPGAANLRGTPTWEEKTCPQCGRVIEVFSTDMSVTCECGFVAYNDAQSCVQWCEYAKECVGEEMYDYVMQRINSEKNERMQKGESE
ncbi:MAG: hypothetical protein LBG82_00190 [Clostridiales Family XIII bacterium]|jgi:hypothetical protein|nr:hypothetical protein [Clostridiales Family XIII bacterium]